MNNVFFVEYLLTYNCNQNCHYCDITHKNVHEPVEVDMDYFKWTIDTLGDHSRNNLMIELCGGETGLISNLPDMIDFLDGHTSVKITQLMSNGQARVNFPESVKKLTNYYEHLIYEIEDTGIVKFYDMDFVESSNAKTVVVMSKKTTKSLLDNTEYYRHMIDSDNFWFKLFTDRSCDLETEHIRLLEEFYTKFDVMYADHYIKELRGVRELTSGGFARTVCQKSPFLPSINLVDKKIVHCAYHNFTDPINFDLTEGNLKDMIDKRLFTGVRAKYCDDCYQYYNNPMFLIKKNKSNREL